MGLRRRAPARAAALACAGLWLSLLVQPLPAQAAPAGIAFLSTSDEAGDKARLALLREALARFGLAGGRVRIDHYQIAASDPPLAVHAMLVERLPRYAVVMANTMLLAQVAKRAAPAVPLVFSGNSNPQRSCLVQSMARPGGNATGYTSALPDEAKMLEALIDTFPAVTQVMVLIDANEAGYASCDDKPPPPLPSAAPCLAGVNAEVEQGTDFMRVGELRAAARKRSVGLVFLHLCRREDFARIALEIGRRPGVGLIIPLNYLFYVGRSELVATIAASRVPALYARRYFLDEGAAVSLSPLNDAGLRRAYEMVAQVLLGRDPGSIPVEVPFGYELTISVSGAQRAGLQPSAFALRRAQEVRP